VTVPVAFR